MWQGKKRDNDSEHPQRRDKIRPRPWMWNKNHRHFSVQEPWFDKEPTWWILHLRQQIKVRDFGEGREDVDRDIKDGPGSAGGEDCSFVRAKEGRSQVAPEDIKEYERDNGVQVLMTGSLMMDFYDLFVVTKSISTVISWLIDDWL